MGSIINGWEHLAGRYRVEALLGEGSMGQVFCVYDEHEQRLCALKLLRPNIAGPEHHYRLKREFRAAARLEHPHCVRCYEMGEHAGHAFLTMQYVPGGALRLQRWSSIAAVVDLALQLLSGLDAIHAQGMIHRDIKPQNILVEPTHAMGTDLAPLARLGDFGIARISDVHGDHIGPLVGSLRFAAPEALEHGMVDPRSDLYSLGIVLYCLLAGQHPFGDQPRIPQQWLKLHRQGQMTPLSQHRPELPSALCKLVHHMCQREPDARLADAASAYDAVEQLSTSLPESVPRRTHPPLERRPYLTSPAFVGRDVQAEQLHDFFQANLAGERGPSTLLIRGPAGQGKSRLLREGLLEALEADVCVFFGTCRAEGGTAYEPVSELLLTLRQTALQRDAVVAVSQRLSLQAASSTDPTADASIPAVATADLARLLGSKEQFEVPSEDKAADRVRLHERWTSLLRTLSQHQSVLIVVEDLQWADPPTLQLLSSIARAIATARQVGESWATSVVVTMRQTDLPDVVAYREALEAYDTCEVLDLPPLGDADATTLVASMLTTPSALVPEAFARRVQHTAEGNPLFLSQLLHALLDQQQLTRDRQGRWQLDAALLDGVNLPISVDAAIGERAARLSTLSKQVLATASILGRRFEFRALVALSGRDELSVLDALDALVRVDFVEELRQDYQFVHDRVREAVYSELEHQTRLRLHRDAAEYLVSHHGEEPGFWPALAHHWAQAGQYTLAHEYALKAADHAFEHYAYGTAAEFYGAALHAAQQGDNVQDFSKLLERQGDAYAAVGRYPDAVACYEQRLGADPPDDEQLMVLSKLADLVFKQGQYDKSAKAQDDVMRLVGLPPPKTKPELMLRMLRLFVALVLPPRRWRGSTLRGEIIMRASTMLSENWYFLGYPTRAMYNSLLTTVTARRVGPCAASIRALGSYGFLLVTLGLKRQSQRYIAQARAYSQQFNVPASDLSILTNTEAYCELIQGNTDRALELFDAAAPRFANCSSTEARIVHFAGRGLLHVYAGRHYRLCAQLQDQMRRLGEELNDNRLRMWYHQQRGLRLSRLGQIDEALSAWHASIRVAEVANSEITRCGSNNMLALFLALRGDIEEALKHGMQAAQVALRMGIRLFGSIDEGFLVAAAVAVQHGRSLSSAQAQVVRRVLRERPAATKHSVLAREIFAVSRAAWQAVNREVADFEGPITRLRQAHLFGEAWIGHHIAANFDKGQAGRHEQAKAELQRGFLA